MKRFLGLAAAMMLAAATGAHAQGGPVNHKGSAGAAATQPPVEADMPAPFPPPTPPGPDFSSRLGQIQVTIQGDLDQHKISRRRASHLRRKLRVIERRAEALDHRLARIAASLP